MICLKKSTVLHCKKFESLYDDIYSFILNRCIFIIHEKEKDISLMYLPYIILETPDELHSHISKLIFSPFQVHYDLHLKA